jgi:hypothetical protein
LLHCTKRRQAPPHRRRAYRKWQVGASGEKPPEKSDPGGSKNVNNKHLEQIDDGFDENFRTGARGDDGRGAYLA